MKMQKNRNSQSLPAGRHNGTQPLWNMVWHVIKLNTVLTCNAAITRLGIYPIHLKIYIHTNNCMRMFIEALFIIARSKQSQQVNTFLKKKKVFQELPYDPVVKTLCFHCRGLRFNPSSGKFHATWCSQKKNHLPHNGILLTKKKEWTM